jgi:4-amino-4-deoxy-L-arabinose transferase-like glycosyltransferase
MDTPLRNLVIFCVLTVINVILFFLWYRQFLKRKPTSPEKDADTEFPEGEEDVDEKEELSQQSFLLQSEPNEIKTSPVEYNIKLPPGARVQITIETDSPEDFPGSEIAIETSTHPRSHRNRNRLALWKLQLQSWVDRWPYSIEQTFFGAGLIIYLLTRLVGLTEFPIYFFSDEAIQTNLAADFVAKNFRNAQNEFMPTYFVNVDKHSLGVSVYAQVIPYLLFGKSVFITRSVSVLVSIIAVWGVGLILRDIFKIPYWWSGVFLLSITPAWFLHSRTAFETTMMVAFYVGFLYFYLLYRHKNPKHLYKSLIFGALVFYTYNPGRLVILVTGILLFISDIRYHWKNRSIAFRGFGLLCILALPYARFQVTHPTANSDHLRLLASYWVQPISWLEKLTRFFNEYLFGLSPGYWFIPNQHDLERHLMKGYGHILASMLPFAALGIGITISKFRSSAYRTLLFALLAAPTGAALVHIGVTRALSFVIPSSLLTALGLSTALTWLEQRGAKRFLLNASLLILLIVGNFTMLSDALSNGPTWYKNYSLGGMQYGAQQLYGEVKGYLDENPTVDLVVTPTWTNGAETVGRFFFIDPIPFRFGSVNTYMNHLMDLNHDTTFVTTAEEYDQVVSSGKFTDLIIEKTIPYPDGRTGFYFLKMKYVDEIEEILIRELEERRELVETQIMVDDEIISMKHSRLDMGGAQDMFDNDLNSVARTLETNVFVIEMEFPSTRQISSISLVFGSASIELTALLYEDFDSQPLSFKFAERGSVDNPSAKFDLRDTYPIQRLRLEVKDLNESVTGHVHLWEIGLE